MKCATNDYYRTEMKLPSIDVKALLARLRDPRSLNWKTVAGIAAVVVALVLLYRGSGTKALFFSEENAAAGNTIVGGLESFKRATGRYPDKLALLSPTHIAEIPQPAAETNFIYAVSADGKECWFGYQVYSGVLNEYECATKKWAYREYEDSDALRSYRKEFVMGPKG